jgi:hypothetical protein
LRALAVVLGARLRLLVYDRRYLSGMGVGWLWAPER